MMSPEVFLEDEDEDILDQIRNLQAVRPGPSCPMSLLLPTLAPLSLKRRIESNLQLLKLFRTSRLVKVS